MHIHTDTQTQSRWLIDQKFIVLEREDYELQPLNSLFANICLGNYGYTASIFFESCQTFGSLKLYPYVVLTLSLTNMAYLMSYRANNFLSTLAYSITWAACLLIPSVVRSASCRDTSRYMEDAASVEVAIMARCCQTNKNIK